MGQEGQKEVKLSKISKLNSQYGENMKSANMGKLVLATSGGAL